MESSNRHDLAQWVNEQLTLLDRPFLAGDQPRPDSARAFTRLKERRRAETGRGKVAALAIGGIVATWPLIALPSTREFVERCVSACVGESGQLFGVRVLAPDSGARYRKADNREPAPDFVLNDMSGNPLKLSDSRKSGPSELLDDVVRSVPVGDPVVHRVP